MKNSGKLINKLLASMTALLSLAATSYTPLATNIDMIAQSATTSAYKKSQVDEYEDIIAKIKAMPDEEVKQSLDKYKQLYKEYAAWHYNMLIVGDLFKSYNANKNLSEFTKEQKQLFLCMHLEVFMKKHPEYFESSKGQFSDATFSELKYLESLSDNELLNNIEFEKKRFENLGAIGNIKYFKIEDDIEKAISPKVLLITLRKINSIFEKYKKLTDKIISALKSERAKFKIHSFDSESGSGTLMFVRECYYTQEHRHKRIANIFLSKRLLSNVKLLFSAQLVEVLNGFSTYIEGRELISSIVAHEMGHVFEQLLARIVRKTAIEKGIINPHQYTFSKFYNGFMHKIKQKIIEISKEKYGATNERIGEYGETKNAEWFAEVFTNLECSDEENISPYGKAMKDIIEMFENDKISDEDIKYLSDFKEQ